MKFSTARQLALKLILAAALLTGGVQLYADSATETTVTPGLVYREFVRDSGPWAIQVLELDRKASGLGVTAELGRGQVLGIEPLDSLIIRTEPKFDSLGRDVVAAINADFYALAKGPFQGDLVGLCVFDTELVSSPVKRSALVFNGSGDPVIDRYSLDAALIRADGSEFTVRGINQHCPKDAIVVINQYFGPQTRPQDGLVAVRATHLKDTPLALGGRLNFEVSAPASSDSTFEVTDDSLLFLGRGKGADFLDGLKRGETVTLDMWLDPDPGAVMSAVGGTPRLLRNGAVSIEADAEGISEAFVTNRHPRTAFGYNESTMYFVTVDGRRAGHSAGMSLDELAALMQELGATEAVNLDGGGSTTMWVEGQIKNRPSDNRVRPIANALLIYKTK